MAENYVATAYVASNDHALGETTVVQFRCHPLIDDNVLLGGEPMLRTWTPRRIVKPAKNGGRCKSRDREQTNAIKSLFFSPGKSVKHRFHSAAITAGNNSKYRTTATFSGLFMGARLSTLSIDGHTRVFKHETDGEA